MARRPIRIEVEVSKTGRPVIRAFHGSEEVGILRLRPLRTGIMVAEVEVQMRYRHEGIGTRMYERAAAIACERFGQPLRSDTARSREAESFWRKQERKGRAEFVSETPRGVRVMPDEDIGYFRLTCPAPDTLAGLRRRKR